MLPMRTVFTPAMAVMALCTAVAGCSGDGASSLLTAPDRPSANHYYNATLYYSANVEGIGWQPFVRHGQMAGTTGQFRRMEALKIDAYSYTPSDPPAKLCYQAHVENIGWQPAVCGNGKMVGTEGQNLRMEAVRIWFVNVYGGLAPYDVCYRAHVEDLGWLPTVCNGQTAGTTGQFRRMEAIVINPYIAYH
jgi:uncharacterized protein YjdB